MIQKLKQFIISVNYHNAFRPTQNKKVGETRLMSTLQEKIIQEMGVQPTIDAQEEIRVSIDFMKAYLYKHPFLKTFVLGISGGQDSTLLGKLAQMAMEEMREETKDAAYQFIGLRLPYGIQFDEADVDMAFEWIAPDSVMEINIKVAVDALVDEFTQAGLAISDFNKGNIKARQRMIAQFAVAGDAKGVVLGTDHAAEAITGFYTKFGDGAADLMPLYRLNKRQGVAILKELESPAPLYEKIPTADLQDGKPGLSDEDELGVSYQSIDDYLEGKEVSVEAKERIETLYRNSKHKRHTPITVFDEFWKK